MTACTSVWRPLMIGLVIVGLGTSACSRTQPPAPSNEGSSTSSATEQTGSAATPEEGSVAAAATAEDTSNAVATVDGRSVMDADELQRELDGIVERYERLPNREPTDARWRNARRRRLVEDAIGATLIEQYVSAQPVEISPDELDAYIRSEIGHVYTDDRLFERFVQSRGETRESYLADKRMELMTDRVLALRGQIEPSDEDVERFYNDNRARWEERERVLARVITVRLRQNAPPEQDAQARARIEELRRRVTDGGEDFSEVATTASESADRLRGGDLGWVARGSRVQFEQDGIESVLFRVPVGTVTEPLRTQLGYQVFEIRDRRPAGVRELDEVRDVIVSPLRRRNRERLRSEAILELRRAADIEMFEERWGLEPEGAEAADGSAP